LARQSVNVAAGPLYSATAVPSPGKKIEIQEEKWITIIKILVKLKTKILRPYRVEFSDFPIGSNDLLVKCIHNKRSCSKIEHDSAP
jgi:hypothetical protein